MSFPMKSSMLALAAAAALAGLSACGNNDQSFDHLVVWNSAVDITCPGAASKNFDTCYYEAPTGNNTMGVAAVNSDNRVVTSYESTWTFSSTDAGAEFRLADSDGDPIDPPFTSYVTKTDGDCKDTVTAAESQCDFGYVEFVVTLVAEGSQTVTVTDAKGSKAVLSMTVTTPAP